MARHRRYHDNVDALSCDHPTTPAHLQTSRSGEMETPTWLSQDSGLSVGCNLTDTYVYTDHFEYLRKDTQETIVIAASSWERKSGVGGRAQKNLLFI